MLMMTLSARRLYERLQISTSSNREMWPTGQFKATEHLESSRNILKEPEGLSAVINADTSKLMVVVG